MKVIPIRKARQMSVEDQNLCIEFSKRMQYLIDKYYAKTEFPTLINETAFAVVARILQCYRPEQREVILKDISKIADSAQVQATT